MTVDGSAALSAAEALDRLLALHPDAAVNAVNDRGVVVDLPPSIVLRGQHVHRVTSAMDLVSPADWPAVIGAWDTAITDGVGVATVRLIEDGSAALVHLLDVRAEHGVLVGLYHATEDGPVAATPRAPAAALAPRFAQVRKDAVAMLTQVDDNAARMLGQRADELLGRRTSELVHPDDHELAIGAWMEMLSTPGLGRRTRLRHLHADGRWIWLEVTNHNLLEDPAYGCVLADLVDVSEEMAAQEMVRARQELLDRLAETVPVGLLQLDHGGHVVYANNRLLEILGRPLAATALDQLAAVLPPDLERWQTALAEVLAGAQEAELELRVDGPAEQRTCQTSLRALRDRDGRVSGVIACLTDTTHSVLLRQQLHVRATVDALTGCLNRASVLAHLDDVLRRREPGTGTALAFCDLDRFKHVNDEHGHAAGDEVLRQVAQRLRRFVRDGQVVGRLGGDEFLVVCPAVPGQPHAEALGARLQAALDRPVTLPSGVSVPVQVSVGISWSGRGSADELVAAADAAMYLRKRDREHSA